MICETKTQATNVAKAGAAKMTKQGYRMVYLQKPLPVDVRFAVRVDNILAGISYRLNLNTRHCSCPFFADNAEFKVCKHLLWADAEKAGDVAEAEYQAAETARVNEAERFARARIKAINEGPLTDAGTRLSEEYADVLEQGYRF